MGLFDFFKKPKDTAPTAEAPKAPDTLAPPPPRSDLIQATQAPERALHERAVTRAELSNSNRINLSRSQTVDNSALPPAPSIAPQNSLPHARKLVLGDSLPPLHAHAEEPLADTCAATTENNIQILPPPQASKAELAANARAAQVSALKNPPSSPKQAQIVLSKNANAHLPVLEFLNVLPANCVASGAIAHARSNNAEVAISREEAIGLLSLGSFRFYACGVCDKLPAEYLTPMANRDESVLEIPLIKILPVIPIEWLKISGQDESRLETLELINDPFRDIFVKQAPRSPTAPPVSPIPQQAPPKPSPASQHRDVLRLPVQSLASRLPAEAVAKASQGEIEFDRNTVLDLLALGSFAPSYALIAKLVPGLLQTNAASLDESCSIPLSEILPLLPPSWLDAAPEQDRSRLATLIEMNDPFSGAFTDAAPKAKAKPESAPAAKAPEPSTPAKAPPTAPATPPKAAKIQDSGMDLILGNAFLDSAIKLKEPTAFDLSVEDTMIGRVPPAPQLPGKAKTLPLRNTTTSPLPPPPEAPPASGIKPKSIPLKTNHNIDLIVVEEESFAPAVKTKSIPLKTNHSLDPLPDAEATAPAAIKAKSIPLKTETPKPRMVQPEEDLISLDCVEEKTPSKQMPPPLRPSGGMRKEIVSLEATDDGLAPRPSTEAQFIAPPPPQKPIASNIPRPPKKPARTEFDNDNDLVLVNSSTPFVPKNLDTSVKEFSRSQAMKVDAAQPAKAEAPQPQASHAHPEAPQAKDDPSRRSTAPCIISLKNAKADTLLELPGYSPAVASALISAAQQGRITDLASIAKIPGIDQKTFHQLTGLNPGDSLLAAERRLNVAAGLDPNQDFTLSTILAGLTRKLGWHAALLISSGGLRASASGDTGKISVDLDLAAAVIPQLIRRSSHSFGHAGLPPLNEISLHLGDHNLRFLPCGEAFLILALPGTDPDPELMRRSREIATHLAWYCSSRLVP